MSDRLIDYSWAILTNRLTRDLRVVMVLYAVAQLAWGYVTLMNDEMMALNVYSHIDRAVGLLVLLSSVPLGVGMAYRMPRTACFGAVVGVLAWSICSVSFAQVGALTGTVMYTLAALVSMYAALRTLSSWALPRPSRIRRDPSPISL